MKFERKIITPKVVVPMAVLLLATVLSGCGSTLTDLPIVGEPANVPRQAGEAPAYLAVHDMPPPRSEPLMTSADQAKVQNDLVAQRDRQAATAQAEAARDAQEAQPPQKSAAKPTKTAAKTAAKNAPKAGPKTTGQVQGRASAASSNNTGQQ